MTAERRAGTSGHEQSETSRVEEPAGAESADAVDGYSQADARTPQTERTADQPRRAPPGAEFGWEGWLLVALVVVSFLVLPPVLIVLPQAQGLLSDLGLGLRDAYLALPMIPAILLALVAVWAAVRSRQR